MTKDSQSRKWQITINNPVDKGYTHDYLKEHLAKFKSCVYWCMSDEVGLKDHTPHTHVFMACSSGVRFSTLMKHFEGAHFEMCKGTSQDNRDYVFKQGKFEGSKKEDTRVDGTQEEWGEMPVERQGKRNDLEDLYDMIRSGMSTYDILQIAPEYMLNLTNIEQTRLVVNQEKFRHTFRKLDVTYIFGETGCGKTRYVMEKYGYENVYRVTNYTHPFDSYQGQDVILFDEFRSSLCLGDMLKYLDGYPVDLPCRFSDKHACFTKVYFTTNISLHEQYTDIQRRELETWNAFLRRIHHVHIYGKGGKKLELSIQEYLDRQYDWKDASDVPFFQ